MNAKTLLQLGNVLDQQHGGKVRVMLGAFFALLTALLALLQSVVDVLDSFPKWQGVGSVLLVLQSGLISPIGKFTAWGNRAIPQGTPL